MRKHVIKILSSFILGMMMISYLPELNAQEILYTADEARWPGCNGVLGTISDQVCLDNMKSNGILPQDTRNMKAQTLSISGVHKDGTVFQDSSIYFSKDDFRPQGVCCAIKEKLGYHCQEDAGICDFIITVEDSLRTALAELQGFKDCFEYTEPVRYIKNGIFYFKWCEYNYEVPIPINVFSIEPLQEICAGDTLEWNGQKIIEAGTYTHHIIEENRDSMVILNVDVKEVSQMQISKILKEGEITTFAGDSISTAGTYSDTLKTANGCDSIVTLTVTLQTPEPNICEQRDSLWRELNGLFVELMTTSDSKIDYAGQTRFKINRWSFGSRIGYEWRLPNNSLLLNKKDCWGESLKLYILAKTTPKTFVEDECSCNNLSYNSLWTLGVGGEYRTHWYRNWPFVFSAGIGGEVLYNQVRIKDEKLSDPNEVHADLFISPRADYTFSNSRPVNITAFAEMPIRILNNPYRGVGFNIGVRVGFGGKKLPKSAKRSSRRSKADSGSLLQNQNSSDTEKSDSLLKNQ